MSLYPKQTEKKNEIINNLKTIDFINNGLYVAGEMGVGKTYIASAVLNELSHYKSLVIAPANVLKKWKTILDEYAPTKKITIYQNSKKYDITELEKSDIIIIQNSKLLKILELFNPNDFDFLIYDEIHELTPNPKKREILQTFTKNMKPINYKLYLTGTIFNQNYSNMGRLFEITHPTLFKIHIQNENGKYAEFDSIYSDNLPAFMHDFWRYISINLSLNDLKDVLKKDNESEIKQEIAPIELIVPSTEEIMFYEIAKHQYAELGFSNPAEKATNLIDYPRSDLYESKKSKKNLTLMTPYSYRTDSDKIEKAPQIKSLELGISLTNIDLTKSKKYQELISIIDNKKENTIVFVNDLKLINKLNELLTKAGYAVDTMPSKIQPTEYSEYINKSFETNDIFIIDPKKISTGVDINMASRIVWYQLLNDLAKTLQAQRRIYRLSSDKSSTVHFLAYAQTYQEQLIKNISNNAKNNAASYGTNDTSNLAKLTGLLFGNSQTIEKRNI